MSGERYCIATLRDMASIPDEAQARFVAELPAILRTLRQVERAVDDLAAEMRAKAPWWLRRLPPSWFRAAILNTRGLIWVDDDKGTATICARLRDGGAEFFHRSERME